MTELSEKHYSIDPGKGKKMDGCPYSIYEDGHDVKEFIIPPKGFVFVGFQFDPNARNQIYDGKLTATWYVSTTGGVSVGVSSSSGGCKAMGSTALSLLLISALARKK